jgi:L-asparaginase II
MHLKIDVLVWRGATVESRHRVQAAVCDLEGRREAETGQPDLVTTFRSAAKPFQVLPLVERGHADRWGWSDEQLAVMSASHTGSSAHLGRVTGILDRMGLGPERLACGYHDPVDPGSLAHLSTHPGDRSALYNNCSGKHAGMLCLALSEGWPIEGYERPEHPVQQLMRQTVAEACAGSVDSVSVSVDGCGVSAFALPLHRMARAYALLASAAPEDGPRSRALHRIRGAMTAFPRVVGAEGRFSTGLMEATRGRLVVKGGAEGLQCVGWPGRRLGLAIKCEDGQARAVAPATVALLERLDALEADDLERLATWRRPVARNHAGLEVGALEAVIRAPVPLPLSVSVS